VSENPLGKKSAYSFLYDPSLLYPVPRRENRSAHGIDSSLFSGYDIWNAYELSWLDLKGKPEVRILRIIYSAASENIVESKSLKLYLNSFTMTRFACQQDVAERIRSDLEKILNTPFVHVRLYGQDSDAYELTRFSPELLIDEMDISLDEYDLNKNLLSLKPGEGSNVERVSHLLKTNCPITGQPDWATLYIRYSAHKRLDDASLLRYIVSYRNHSGFHETCCEQIYTDLYEVLSPGLLEVKCFFTRRGGIDINPVRFSAETDPPVDECFHYFRQ